jgi:hypothetical protein
MHTYEYTNGIPQTPEIQLMETQKIRFLLLAAQ